MKSNLLLFNLGVEHLLGALFYRLHGEADAVGEFDDTGLLDGSCNTTVTY